MASARHRVAARAGLLLAFLPLVACLEVTGESGPGDALSAVAFYDGDVTVTGPRGYCIDRGSVKRSPGGRFALLASCESLTAQAGIAVEPAVMTVAVLPRAGGAEQPSAAAMAEALGPEAVRGAEDGDGLALVHVARGGDKVLPGGDPSHWRASMVINGHLVGLAAYGPEGGTVAGTGGRVLLRDLAEAMRDASPAPGTASQTAIHPAGRGTLFGGLFPVSN
ncbi:hypothetical protein RA2_01619 [Roseovarius sp. A-2]|uniref:hypothetical protein n=1 Tax=Roseovarius sp. A-2 TaxID=1570360 RepID=UPI0009B56B43|nr:hypothetical protein [Roseovarius sp. A-2]GAW34569.1 hypothetical protein RA2_01619 [Roseovarius sp. A-2]